MLIDHGGADRPGILLGQWGQCIVLALTLGACVNAAAVRSVRVRGSAEPQPIPPKV